MLVRTQIILIKSVYHWKDEGLFFLSWFPQGLIEFLFYSDSLVLYLISLFSLVPHICPTNVLPVSCCCPTLFFIEARHSSPLLPCGLVFLVRRVAFFVWAIPFGFTVFLGFEISPAGSVPLPRDLSACLSDFGLTKDAESCFTPAFCCIAVIPWEFLPPKGSSELAWQLKVAQDLRVN